MYKTLCFFLTILLILAVTNSAQKGVAEAGYYPKPYAGTTWTGKVTAFDNKHRTLTLTYSKGTKTQTFIADIPDAPYDQTNASGSITIIDFPYDKDAKFQNYRWSSPAGGIASIAPLELNTRKPNPPNSNRITDFGNFVGRTITVYYTSRERQVSGTNEKYNDVWRIKAFPK